MIRRAVQRTAQAAFWTLAGVLLCLVMALPTTLVKLVFGSPY
jgi:hypothetical protein